MTHPPAAIDRVASVLFDHFERLTYPEGQSIAGAILDALVVDDPLLSRHADGSITVRWPDGVDPQRNPAEGAQCVLAVARLLANLVDERNELVRVVNAARAAASADA